MKKRTKRRQVERRLDPSVLFPSVLADTDLCYTDFRMEDLIRELVSLGLSEKEAAIYLALLELSPASVQDVANKSKVNRATTYLLVDTLAKRGIVSTTAVGSKQLFVAEPPERLVTILRLQRQELEEKERELLGKIPLLNAIYNARGEKPRIRYFEGAEGLRAARELFMETEGECVQIVPMDDARGVAEIIEQRPEHFAELAQKKVTFRSLVVTEDPSAYRAPDALLGETRVVSAAEFPIHAEVTVRGNLVIMFSFKPTLLSVVITSREFSDAIRALFEMAWKSQKK